MTYTRLALVCLLAFSTLQADDDFKKNRSPTKRSNKKQSSLSITQVYENTSTFKSTSANEEFDSLTRFQIETNSRFFFGVSSKNNWFLTRPGSQEKVYYKLKAITPFQQKFINLDADDNIVNLAQTRATATPTRNDFSFFISLDGAKNGNTRFSAGTYSDQLTFCVGTDPDDDNCDDDDWDDDDRDHDDRDHDDRDHDDHDDDDDDDDDKRRNSR